MAEGRRFKSWNIFDSALIKNANGHHYWENRRLADELLRRREIVRLFSHKDAPTAEEFPGVPIVPVFSLFLYQNISDDRTWEKLENFVVHNRAFADDISRLNSALFEDSLVLFRWLERGSFSGSFAGSAAFEGEWFQGGRVPDRAMGMVQDRPQDRPLQDRVEGLSA